MGSFGSRRLSSSYLSAIPVIDLIYRGKKVEGFMVTRAFAKLGSLEAGQVFFYPNQRPRGHVLSRIRPYSAVLTVLVAPRPHAVL